MLQAKTPKLSIGMATFDDHDGVYFTIQALRMYHPICSTDDVEFVVIDNNPNSNHGLTVKNFTNGWINGKYIPYSNKKSTSIRNEVFRNARGEYTLCVDCHVMIESGGITALMDYYVNNPDTNNLVQGPLWYDDLTNYSTHFDTVWRENMYGIWGTNGDAYKEGLPFEIPMQGLGLFSCKTDKWLGFSDKFRGFGGEEGYIHEKFRQNGGKCVCLPNLKWMHRFNRPDGIKYPLDLNDRIWNYIIGGMELYKDETHPFMLSIKEHFKDKISDKLYNNYIELAKANI
jgi:hypothetical protein